MTMVFSSPHDLQKHLDECGKDDIEQYILMFDTIVSAIGYSNVSTLVKEEAYYYMQNKLAEVDFNLQDEI